MVSAYSIEATEGTSGSESRVGSRRERRACLDGPTNEDYNGRRRGSPCSKGVKPVKRTSPWLMSLVLVSLAATLAAQPTDPLSAALKRQWDNIALNLKESAEVVPAERYSFKPSQDVKTFAGEMGHAANTHYFFCARIKGEANPNKTDYEKETNKDALVKAVIASNEYCSSVINAANDKWLMEMVGQGAQTQPRGAILAAHIAHSNETYGTVVPYMRMSGVVPPSTARAMKK